MKSISASDLVLPKSLRFHEIIVTFCPYKVVAKTTEDKIAKIISLNERI